MKRIFLFLLFSFGILHAFATHNKAGEITFSFISGYTYKISIITYTDSAAPADRDKLEILWGDGTSDSLTRGNGPDLNPINGFPDGEYILGFATKKNIYEGTHTYPGQSTYVISMEDLNRVGGVNNMPNSLNTAFYVQTVLLINNDFLSPPDNSPILTFPPVDRACIHHLFVHNAGAYDPDPGDSLSYELDSSRGAGGVTPTGYTLPAGITLNPVTGDFIWDSPNQLGYYNFAFRIVEWRNGVKIGYVTRDMMVIVQTCIDNPPVIHPPPDLCVLAGDSANFSITATDIDNDWVRMYCTGVTQTYPSPNTSSFSYDSVPGLTSGKFKWLTDCSNVRQFPFIVYFKAIDSNPMHLVDFKEVNIRVVAPAPQNPSASPSGTSIFLHWDPSPCPQAVAYKIYRRNSHFNGSIPCPCETGVPDYAGFSLISTVNGISTTSFEDNNNGEGLIHGNNYCYLIVAVFPDGAQSCASTQVCAELRKDVPVITNVDIQNTDETNGKVMLAWSMPTQIDSVQNPPPYRVKVFRSVDHGLNFTLIDTRSVLTDTILFDTFNTVADTFYYKLELHNDSPSNDHLIGVSHTASSIFLHVSATDNRLNLSWNLNVPWTNSRYDIYRQNFSTSLFDSVGTTTDLAYSDLDLINGITYCYKIKSVGQYSGTGFVNPIINFSQILCRTPIDNVPPCSPVLNVTAECTEFRNSLYWNNPNLTCSDDVLSYNLYYASTINDAPALLLSFALPSDTSYVHEKLVATNAGCYYLTAVDSAGNESLDAQKICVESCPEYSLPNIFTPDGDGQNDFFHPFPYRYVQSVDMQIYNRWGQLMFHTENPEINWDGKNQFSKKDCPDGVYYYLCRVNTLKLAGVESYELKGFVHMINSTEKNSSK